MGVEVPGLDAQLLLTQAFNSLYEREVLEALQIKYDYTFLLAILDIKHIFFLSPDTRL